MQQLGRVLGRTDIRILVLLTCGFLLAGLALAIAQVAKSEDYSNHLWLSIQDPTKSEIAAHIPSGFTNRVEVLVCTNLLDFWWTLAATNILTEGTDTVFWTYEMAEEETGPVFVAIGNADVDSDGDGIVDAREKFLYHTDGSLADTDGDGATDGQEIGAGTNPRNNPGDSDNDGLSDDLEVVLETDPDMADTDGDWVSDGYEYEQATDPLNSVSVPVLRMEVDGGEFYAKSTTLEILIRGLVADELIMAESLTMENSITNPSSELAYFNLNGDENGDRSVAVAAVRGGVTGFTAVASIILDTVLPYLSVTNPSSGLITADRWVKIEGVATDGVSSVCVKLNGGWADGVSAGQFWKTHFMLSPGTNLIDITGADAAGHCVTQSLAIVQDLSLDTNEPVMSLDLPSDFTVQGGATNWNYGVTTFGDETNLAFRGSIDDETAVVNVMVESPLGTNGPYSAGVGGRTQVWGEVVLFEGSNRLVATAVDAAGNVSTCVWSVIRDTSFVFRITNPVPWQVVNGHSVYVTCVADPEFSNAVVTVNGQAASVVSAGNLTFRTDEAVPLGDGVTKLSACAVLNGQSHYADPNVTKYRITRWESTKHEDANSTFLYESDDFPFQYSIERQDDECAWDKDSQIYEYCYRLYWWGKTWAGVAEDGDYSDCTTNLATNWPNGSTTFGMAKYRWSNYEVIGCDNIAHDGELAFIDDSMIKDKELVYLQFPGLDYGRATNAAIDPAEITFRGQPGFWYNSNVTFIAEIERNTEYVITALDFDWPTYINIDTGFTWGNPSLPWIREHSGHWLTIGSVVMTVLKVDLVPDFNHDAEITDDDKSLLTSSAPFHFWVNDDDDDGNEASGDSDMPGQSDGNYGDTEVNGRCDLLDFFPVWLDLHDTLNLLPPSSSVQYKLRQANGAVKAVYTDLTKGQAGVYLTTAGNTYGPSFNQNSYQASTFAITSSGVPLSTDFLDKIKNDATKGILMMEGVAQTTSPLVLEVWKDGTKICEREMPLKLSGVEAMYRWVNLRHVTGGSETRATDTSEPANYPDSLCNGKQFVFVPGYNSSESGARAWNAEVFKRLYQSGSRAMYTAVTWQGDETPGVLPPGAYYHADVINAFQAASSLASSVASLPGQKCLAAHSLGNMAVSSAVVDHSLNPARYFMIDTAVAMEAYKSSERQPGDIAISPWPDYTNRVWASQWYNLFDASDGRNHLTWRGRFGNISQAVNYYSSGEDVLNNNETGEEVSLFDAPDRVWVFQEQVKGGILPEILIGVDSHGGWGFNGEYSTGVYDPSNDVYVTATTPAEAALLPDYMLRAHSFFKLFYDDDLYGAGGSALAADADVRDKVLAEAIPATSRATGRNSISLTFDANVDLMTKKTGWPRTNENWLHSDFKNVAFPYVHQFFEDMVAKGDLQ